MALDDLIMDIIHFFLGYTQPPICHPSKAKIHGTCLFSEEYTTNEQFQKLYQLLKTQDPVPMIRLPFSQDKGTWTQIDNIINFSSKNGIDICILLDCYYSDASMKERIKHIVEKHRNIKHFELFNELPQCQYVGEQIAGLDQLILKINEYSNLIHNYAPGSKVVSMAPVNSLDNVDFEVQWGNNQMQLERLIKETNTDIVGIHCYVSSSSKRYRFRALMNNVEKWNSGINKKIWVTETGIDDWDKHVDYYYEWASRFIEYLNAEKVFWYRQTINEKAAQDGNYALEDRKTGGKSPLWKKLEEGKC